MKNFTIEDAFKIHKINSQIISIRLACDFTQRELQKTAVGDDSPLMSKHEREKFYKKERNRVKKSAAKIVGKEVAYMFFDCWKYYKTAKRFQRKYIKYTAENDPFTWVRNRIQNK